MDWIPASYDYLETYNIELVVGRFFSREYSSDTSNVVLNESAVKAMGLEKPIGKPFSIFRQKGKIIGVIKDIHTASLRTQIVPTVFIFMKGFEISVKMNGEKQTEAIQYLRTVWKQFVPERPFDYRFLEDDINRLYTKENKLGTLIKHFTYFAMIVFCMGLFGLVSYIAEQRTKEIGIRKVLGASIPKIIKMFLKEFFVLIFIAHLIALPISYFIMQKWLQNFVYKINLSWGLFFISSLFVVIISLISLGYQTLKTAYSNPVNALRYE